MADDFGIAAHAPAVESSSAISSAQAAPHPLPLQHEHQPAAPPPLIPQPQTYEERQQAYEQQQAAQAAYEQQQAQAAEQQAQAQQFQEVEGLLRSGKPALSVSESKRVADFLARQKDVMILCGSRQ